MYYDSEGWTHHQFTADQVKNTLLTVTKPVYLVQLNHSGTVEYLSCSGSVTFDSQDYDAGGCNIRRLRLYESASIELSASATRIAEVQNYDWRGGICKVYYIPAASGDSLSFNAADAALLLDGVIDTSSFSGEKIKIEAVHKYTVGNMAPGLLFNHFCNHLPAIGESLDWGAVVTNADVPVSVRDDVLTLGPGDPRSYPDGTFVDSRPTVAAVNSAPSIASSAFAATGDGGTVPIVYGRQPIQGHILTAPVISGSYQYIAVGWCLGQIAAVEQSFINDATPPATVEVRHYLGTATQGVDSWLSAVIGSYTDTCVITHRGETVSLAYSVYKIPTALSLGALNFKAIIKGKFVYDPTATSGTDPYSDDNVIDVDFETGGTDRSQYSHTITLSGGATINSSGLQLSSI